MRKIRIYLAFLTCTVFAATIIPMGKTMHVIRFDINQEIVKTAEKSGIPRYSVENINGMISYDGNQIPEDIPVRFSRIGYEISAAPIYSFTMYSDEKRDAMRRVQMASLMIDTRKITTHQQGREATDNIIKQFKSGRWRRYLHIKCPAIRGRSTILDETSKIRTDMECPLDPEYTLTENEWELVMRQNQTYEWLGDGILATLSIQHGKIDDKLDYTIFLKFEDMAQKTAIDKENLERELKEGDAKGWKSSETYKEDGRKQKARNDILERNAFNRGEMYLVRR